MRIVNVTGDKAMDLPATLHDICDWVPVWRQDGFTHLIFREAHNGRDCYIFPANADQFGPEERIDCVVALPLRAFSASDLDWAVQVLATASHTVRVFNGRTFADLTL